MRLNTELAKSVIDRFPEMMHAAAELLRAADGAGLPARKPREVESDDDDEDDDDAPEAPASSPAFEFINTLVAQVIPLVVTGLTSKKLPSIGAILDWRKAVPERAASQAQADNDAATPSEQSSALPPLSPSVMAHFIAIQSALKPDEAALARAVAAELAPAQLREWFDELSKLGVPEAVAKIRDAHREPRQERKSVVIALPFNDYSCLGSITEVIAELVENQDPVITELAQQHSTREGPHRLHPRAPAARRRRREERRPEGRSLRTAATAAHPSQRSELRRARCALPCGRRDHRSEPRASTRDARHAGRDAHVPARERRAGHPRSAREPELSRLRRRGREARAHPRSIHTTHSNGRRSSPSATSRRPATARAACVARATR